MINDVIVTSGVLYRNNLCDSPWEDTTSLVDVLTGSVNVAKCSIPYLRESRGHLVLFTSSSYVRDRPMIATYSATKAGMVAFVQAFAEEEPDIRVNAICPSLTDTPMRRKNLNDKSGLLDPGTVADKVITFLSSDITGSVIEVR